MSKTWRDWNGDAYGTHIPLLKMLGKGGQIRTILELGMGEFSTSLFLDKTVFHKLSYIQSIESDTRWISPVSNRDPRHDVVVKPEPIEGYLATLDLDTFDLIFVDNSTSGDRRMDTLRYISTHVKRSLVVAHDMEVYESAISGFRHCILDESRKPWTALLWK